mmetsp:Transcript_63038/g.152187  ORF Transcript_63038/g.152187 Transcript_63038/m.152187 type:complete len:245 (-) Transcript_63038:833-1567(-)
MGIHRSSTEAAWHAVLCEVSESTVVRPTSRLLGDPHLLAQLLPDRHARLGLGHEPLALVSAHRLHAQHPVGHLAARGLHDVGDGAQLLGVLLGEECDGASRAPRAAGASDAVDVRDGRLGEVVVDDGVDALEVDTACHELCADEDPHLTRAELFDNMVALLLRALGVHDVDVEVVVDELVEELHRALLGLHEDEHGWRKALLDDASQREQLTLLASAEEQSLRHCLSGGVLGAHHYLDRMTPGR